jgi:hypothetical protein
MSDRYRVLALLCCLTWTGIALGDEGVPEASGDPTKIGLMTPEAKSELDNCVAQAAQIAGDDKDRRVMIGVYIGPKGRPVSLAILDSSGLERLDKLVLRCIFRADYIPGAPDKPPIHWVFTSFLKVRPVTPAPSSGGVSLSTQ